MRFLFDQAAGFIGDLWTIGTFFTRVAVLYFVLWPVAIAVVAGSGADWSIIFGFGVFAPAVALAIVFAFPLVFGIVSLTKTGTAAIGTAATVVAAELVWTAYCMIVPVENSPQMLACVMLAGVVGYLASWGASRFAVNVGILANVSIVLMTVLFYFAGQTPEVSTPPKPGSAAYAASRVVEWAKSQIEELDREPPKDSIDLYPDTFDFPVPFEAGESTKVIRAMSFEREGSGWKVMYDIDATAPCKVKFLEDGVEFDEGPGVKLGCGVRTGFFRIVGVGTGVAKVSVWRVPAR